MNVICFGDSNTYGYDPRSYFGGRYSPDSRWPDILGEQTGWAVLNQGENGREIPTAGVRFPPGTDLLIIMLGTNDLLQGRSPAAAAGRMERFLKGINLPREKILLIAPPPVTLGAWVPDRARVDDSAALASRYQALAGRLGIRFANAGDWGVSLAYDGVHFTEPGHRAFAAGLLLALGDLTGRPEQSGGRA